MGKTRIGKAAILCTLIAFVLVITAFVTPYWLETDAKSDKSKFINIGLWQVCFHGFERSKQPYDAKFYGCWWVFEEEYYGLHDILLPDFFIISQFFFTLCITLLIIGTLLTLIYTCCSRQHNKYLLLLWATGSNLTLASICGIIGIVIFGTEGKYTWMSNWEQNTFSWSYVLAVIGSITLFSAGILFLIEGQQHKKRLKELLLETPKMHTSY